MTQIRPQTDEYAANYGKYVELVPDGDPSKILENQLGEWQRVLQPLGEAAGDFRYAPEKWSIKEVVGHVSDAERIFAYRLLRIARGDKTPLPGFEQDDYINAANFSSQRLAVLLEEFGSVRGATLSLLRSLDGVALTRTGTASNNHISARALVYIIAGHAAHHLRILQQRYLPVLRAE